MGTTDESKRYAVHEGHGRAAASFMIIPSTAGTVGLVFSLVSLIPWYVFVIGFAKAFRAECAR